MRRGLNCLLVVALLATGGCGFGTRLAYNHLDWFAFDRLDDYVDLGREQQRALRPVFDHWWRWHRRHQLAEYADFLRELAAGLEAGWTRADLAAAIARVDAYYETAVAELQPFAADFLAALDEEQVAELLASLDERADEFARESVDIDAEQRRQRAVERTRDSLGKRLGRLSDEQVERIRQWSHEREDLNEQWLRSRRAWRDDLAEALATRTEPGFGQRIRPLFVNTAERWPPAHRAAAQRNLDRWIDLVDEVLRMRSSAQHQRLMNQLLDLAADAERLSRQPHD